MAKLTPVQLTELGDTFLALAQAVGDYRMKNRESISAEENRRISDLHWTLLNYADDLYTTSAITVAEDVASSLDEIRKISTEITQTIKSVKGVQRIIDISAAGVTVAASIFSKNPQAIAESVFEFVSLLKNKTET